MSLNFSEGKPVCTLGKKVVYVTDKKDGESSIQAEKETFLPAIDKDTEREVIYVSAPSGSGKSYWCKNYIEQYHKAFPKNRVYVISSLGDDTTLDKLKYLKRIKIKEPEFIRTEITAADFQDALVLFDDTDCIADKKIQLKITEILNSVLETGRHFKVTVIYTSHLMCAGFTTKRIINEAHKYVVFTLTAGKKQLSYLLDTYLGFDKHQIEKVKKLEGRAKVICKTYPICVYGDKEVYVR